MRYATLLFCALLACGVGGSVESVDKSERAARLSTDPSSHADDSLYCSICSRSCVAEEVRCLRELDPDDMCTAGLVCIERAISCEKSSCGGRCSNWILICPPPEQAKHSANLLYRNCFGPKANPCLCYWDICLGVCHRSGFSRACVEECDNQYDLCSAGL